VLVSRDWLDDLLSDDLLSDLVEPVSRLEPEEVDLLSELRDSDREEPVSREDDPELLLSERDPLSLRLLPLSDRLEPLSDRLEPLSLLLDPELRPWASAVINKLALHIAASITTIAERIWLKLFCFMPFILCAS